MSWEDQFDKRFVLDPVEVFFGERDKLKEQGWEVGESKVILKQDLDPKDIKDFIRQVRQDAKAEMIDSLEKELRVIDGTEEMVSLDSVRDRISSIVTAVRSELTSIPSQPEDKNGE